MMPRHRNRSALVLACGMTVAASCWAVAEPVTTGESAALDLRTVLQPDLHAAAPFVCEPARKGAAAMTELANICTCNGTSWVTVGVQSACTWKEGGRE